MSYALHNFAGGERLYAAQLNAMDRGIYEQTMIPTPDGFKWANNPMEGHIFRTEAGITCDLDVATFKPTGKTYWVDPNGSESNSGEDADHPLQLIKTAMNKADAAVVILKNGVYNFPRVPQHLNGYAKNIAVIAAEGANPVLVSEEGVPTFEKTDGYTYVYQSPQRSSCVYDIQNRIAYVPVGSIAEVEATPGTYYSTNTPSNITYFRMINDATPSYTNIKLAKTYDCFRVTASGAITIYIEGLTICGGGYGGLRVTADGTGAKPTVYAKNCKFFGSLMNSALYLEGCNSILQDCEAACAVDDGFGYHSKGVEPTAVEINCIGHHNGLEGGTDNGSTMHDGGSIIRINGEYYSNCGPNVADVHNTTCSWNLGCHAWKANISGQNTQNSDFVCSDGSANMWLDSCSGYGSYYSLLANGTGTVYERNNAFVSRHVGDNCAIKSY